MTCIFTRDAQTGRRVKLETYTQTDALALVHNQSYARRRVRELSIFPKGVVLAVLNGGKMNSRPDGPDAA